MSLKIVIRPSVMKIYSKNNASFLLKMMFAGIVQKKVGTLSLYMYKVEGQFIFPGITT